MLCISYVVVLYIDVIRPIPSFVVSEPDYLNGILDLGSRLHHITHRIASHRIITSYHITTRCWWHFKVVRLVCVFLVGILFVCCCILVANWCVLLLILSSSILVLVLLASLLPVSVTSSCHYIMPSQHVMAWDMDITQKHRSYYNQPSNANNVSQRRRHMTSHDITRHKMDWDETRWLCVVRCMCRVVSCVVRRQSMHVWVLCDKTPCVMYFGGFCCSVCWCTWCGCTCCWLCWYAWMMCCSMLQVDSTWWWDAFTHVDVITTWYIDTETWTCTHDWRATTRWTRRTLTPIQTMFTGFAQQLDARVSHGWHMLRCRNVYSMSCGVMSCDVIWCDEMGCNVMFFVCAVAVAVAAVGVAVMFFWLLTTM